MINKIQGQYTLWCEKAIADEDVVRDLRAMDDEQVEERQTANTLTIYPRMCFLF